jgi:predicted RecA/RadA family phage recombinase
MRNFVQDGNILTLVVPEGGVLSGYPIIVGSIFGIAGRPKLLGRAGRRN